MGSTIGFKENTERFIVGKMKKLTIVKIGGQVLDDAAALTEFVQLFTQIEGQKILVHGGGKTLSELALQLGIEPQFVDGRRITDQASMRLATMVYAGLINKNLVAELQQHQCDALGLSGADAHLIQTVKRATDPIDFGYVGDLTASSINDKRIVQFLELGLCPVFSAITYDDQGQLLNTNADGIASALAIALSKSHCVSLIYCFEKKGVLSDVHDDHAVIPVILATDKEELIARSVISKGMIPKLDNAWSASERGVQSVIIKKSTDLLDVNAGTQIQFHS